MKTLTVYCPDIECDSCVKVLSRVLQRQGIDKFSVNKTSIDLIYNPEYISQDNILNLIKEKGYRASLFPILRKTFRERFRDFLENKHKYELEYKMIKYSLYTFFLLGLLEVIAYAGIFKQQPDFLANYGWWIFYSNLAVISIGSAMWHLKSYRAEVTSMIGMMLGMTFGMQTGLMIGTIIGATNGILVGGLTGMIAGTAVGFYNGKCCGMTGVLEGMMAGVMSGLMGAMIGVMFSVDRILVLMPFFFLINIAVIYGLSYMLFEEVFEHNEKLQKLPVGFFTFFSYCLLAVGVLTVIMIYAPKSGLALLGGF